MEQIKYIKGNTEDEIWEQVTKDLTSDSEALEYRVILQQQETTIRLDIDIDPGGGFESGFESTSLNTPLQKLHDFRFAIHHEGYIDEIGKFFGMEDIETDYPEFDKKVIIKTTDAARVKTIFANNNIRKVFASLTNFTLHIGHHKEGNEKEPYLELEIYKGITDPGELRKIYNAFFTVLVMINIT